MSFDLSTFADAMAYVGNGVEARFEREQVEWVFGLTGGELEDEPLKFRAPGSDHEYKPKPRLLDMTLLEMQNQMLTAAFDEVAPCDDEFCDQSWTYHYEGFPEWASDDFDSDDGTHNHHTLVETGISYSSSAPKLMIFSDGEVWFQVKTYVHSGETECPMGTCGDDETVGEESTAGMQQCPLCGEDAGEKHGYIYVGESCEHVYRHIDFACAECGVPQSELTTDDPICNCDEG